MRFLVLLLFIYALHLTWPHYDYNLQARKLVATETR